SPVRRTPAPTRCRRSSRSRARRSFGQVHPRQLVPYVSELGEERMVDQPPHHLDRRALCSDHVAADRALDDLEVTHPPHGHTLVELDAELGEGVELLIRPPLRVDLDERQACALARRVELLAEQLRDAPQLLEARRVEAAA